MRTSTATNTVTPVTKTTKAKDVTLAKNTSNYKTISGESKTTAEPFAPNSAVERIQGITSFIDSVETQQETLTLPTHQPDTQKLAQDDTLDMSIAAVMARPIFVSNIDWTASSNVGDVLLTLDLPSSLMSLSTIKKEKMDRFQFMSFDIVLRLIGSPMQFQAGRLWFCFEYGGTARGARACGNLPICFTALKGIEYDPGYPAPVELRIPYYCPVSQWDTIGQYGLGYAKLIVLAPLNTASTTASLGLSVQGWFENPVMGVPTQRTMATTAFARIADENAANDIKPLTVAFAQSNAEKDQAAHSYKVSDTLDTVGDISDMMGHFPLISSITTPVSWMSRAAASAARAFGFAKPSNQTVTQRVESFLAPTATHMDGASSAFPLVASSNFDVPQGAYYGTDQDEMDINFICSKTVNIGRYIWSSEETVGGVTAVLPVHPGVCAPIAAKDVILGERYQTSPMSYVASMFKYWAGAIKFRLEAVSTPFHAGRLLITYVPNFDPFYAYSITEAGSNYSIIWDIMDSSHIEFEVPYMGNTPYLNVQIDDLLSSHMFGSPVTAEGVRRARQTMNGAIVVFVLNPLVSPATTSSSIDLLVWMGGGKDLTFAEPSIGSYMPAIDGYHVSTSGHFYDGVAMTQPTASVVPTRIREPISFDESFEMTEDFTLAQAQSGVSIAPETGLDSKNVGSVADSDYQDWMPMRHIDPTTRAGMCTGEVITNLRLLTRRQSPSYVMYPQDVTTSGAMDVYPPTSNHVLVFDPDHFGVDPGNYDNAIYERQFGAVKPGDERKWLTELPNVMRYISHLFTYVRGTRRYLFNSNPSACINGAVFETLHDSDRASNPKDRGEFDIRMSQVLSQSSTPQEPWFRPEETVLEYNDVNNSTSTVGDNKTYGYGSLFGGDSYLKRTNTPGIGVEVTVNPSTRYPVRLLTTPLNGSIALNNITAKRSYPRSRRFLEVRYRPFSTSRKGETANFAGNYWPFPITIMEAAGDDMSFGLVQQAPSIRRVSNNIIYQNANGELTRL